MLTRPKLFFGECCPFYLSFLAVCYIVWVWWCLLSCLLLCVSNRMPLFLISVAASLAPPPPSILQVTPQLPLMGFVARVQENSKCALSCAMIQFCTWLLFWVDERCVCVQPEFFAVCIFVRSSKEARGKEILSLLSLQECSVSSFIELYCL